MPEAVRTIRRARFLVAAAGLAVAGCGATAPASKPTQASSAKPAAAAAARPSGRVSVRRAGRLPAPVQLPAVTATPKGVLAIGGLDSADASVASIVRVTGSRASVIGQLPAALHDA